MKTDFANATLVPAIKEDDFASPNNLLGGLTTRALHIRTVTDALLETPLTDVQRNAILAIREEAIGIAEMTLPVDRQLRETYSGATQDALTGIHNRHWFDRHFDAAIRDARENNRPLALLAFDIDHFKSVNDKHGHDSGDEVLKLFAGQIQKSFRASDLVARIGGEEFLVALPMTAQQKAEELADAARGTIKGRPATKIGQTDVPNITVSIGVAMLAPGDTAETLKKRADEALYKAKQQGRDRVVSASVSLKEYSRNYQP